MVAFSSVLAGAGRGTHLVGAAARRVVRFGGSAATALPSPGRTCDPAEREPVSFVAAQMPGLPAVTVAYERCGAGEPVVLLHGLGMSRRIWNAVIPLLAGEREVVAIDLPGFGQSPDWPAGITRDLPTAVRVLDAVFSALGLQRPHVVGHSLGGLIALRLGQAGLASSVTALAPAGFWSQAERRYAFAVLATARRIARRVPDAVAERLSATAAGRAVLVGMLYGDPLRCRPGAVTTCLHAMREATGFEATLRAGRTSDLFTGTITGIPVTIAWGTQDRILSPRQARRAMAMLPQARLVWLPGCGHVPVNDAPGLVAKLIVEATRPPAVGSG